MTGQQRQKELYKHGFPAGEIKFIYGYFFSDYSLSLHTWVYHFNVFITSLALFCNVHNVFSLLWVSKLLAL